MRRVADVIQVNINKNSGHAADEFKMSQAYTYARISVDIEVKPIIIAIPLIANTIKRKIQIQDGINFTIVG